MSGLLSTLEDTTMNYTFLNNSLLDWTLAITIALLVTGALFVLKRALVRRLTMLASRTTTNIDDLAVTMIGSTRALALLVIGLYAGSTVLEMSGQMQLFLTRLAIATALIQAALWGDAGVRAWLNRYRASHDTDPAKATSTAALGFIARIVLWAVVVLMILDNLGFNITTLVASLGIGGIAVALAVQNILGDLFASLSIAVDKPFEVGDYIAVADFSGTVEHVGLKTTRIRADSGEQVVIANAEMLKNTVRNYKRMRERRVQFSLRLNPGTPLDLAEQVPAALRAVVERQQQVRFDRAHLKTLDLNWIEFELVYFMLDPAYARFMDTQQAILIGARRVFDELGVTMTPAATTVVMESEQGDQMKPVRSISLRR